jgi:hypothetical protein
MNTRFYIPVFFLSLLLLCSASPPEYTPVATLQEEIGIAIKAGNAAVLAKYFNNTLDLVVPGQELTCSKTQAEQILKDFFQKNPPKSFKINHQGASKDGSQFSIGTYVSTADKSFRTYFLLKKSGTSMLIQQLQFEAE